MAERVTFGLDFDGVMVKKAPAYDLFRRSTKMGLPPLLGVHHALDQIVRGRDTSIAGIYTVRPGWLRTGQTRRQIKRHGFGVEHVVHTTNNPTEKVRRFLHETIPYEEADFAVLIDDSYGKIKKAIDELGKDPGMWPFLNRFAFFVFGKEQPQLNTGRNFDPLLPSIYPHGIHVKAGMKDGEVTYSLPIIALPNWSCLPVAFDKLADFKEENPFKLR